MSERITFLIVWAFLTAGCGLFYYALIKIVAAILFWAVHHV